MWIKITWHNVYVRRTCIIINIFQWHIDTACSHGRKRLLWCFNADLWDGVWIAFVLMCLWGVLYVMVDGYSCLLPVSESSFESLRIHFCQLANNLVPVFSWLISIRRYYFYYMSRIVQVCWQVCLCLIVLPHVTSVLNVFNIISMCYANRYSSGYEFPPPPPSLRFLRNWWKLYCHDVWNVIK